MSSFWTPQVAKTLLWLFPRTSIRFEHVPVLYQLKHKQMGRGGRGVTEGMSYLLDVREIPHPQLTVSTPSDQTLLFGQQSHPPDLFRGTT